MTRIRNWRSVAAGAMAACAILIGAVFALSAEHSWPFSLHHGITRPEEGFTHRNVSSDAGPAAAATVRVPIELDPARLNRMGIRVEPVRLETISRPLRSVATVVPDESRISHVHTRVAGWIERLYVNTTGERVRAGQPLAGIFSQELLSSQVEYLSARRGSGAAGAPSVVAEGARSRLKVFGMTESEVAAIERSGEPQRLVTVTAPRSGVVLHRGISVGTAVDPSTEIMTVGDLSRVWVLSEVPESDIPSITQETSAVLEFPGSARGRIEARVDFVYPTLTERTRTVRVRFAVDNADGSLRPGLYGTATFEVRPRVALTVARDAVVDTGVTQHVFVAERDGRFVPRTVELGTRIEDRTEVRAGLRESELVVASGVFLIDSESRLRVSGGGGTGHTHGQESSTSDTPHEKHPRGNESHAPGKPHGQN